MLGNPIDLTVIGIYFLLMIVLGFVGMRIGKGNEESFLVAGRRLGPFTYMSTFSATLLGGISTIGGASLGYQYGISGMALVFMYGLGLMGMALLFNTKLSRLSAYTISETLGLRYGVSSKRISALISTFYLVMVTVSQIIAMGTIFHAILGLSPIVSILLGWSIILLYSILGGMWALTLTDVVMFCIMTVGIFFILLPFGLLEVGGLSGLKEALPATYFSPIGIGVTTIFSYFLLFFFGVMVDQSLWQRAFTARNEKVARWGGVAAGAYTMIYGLAAALIGSAAKVVFPNLSNPDNAFAYLAQEIIPIGLLGLVAAAALSALMSTSSAMLLGASTTLTNDLYNDFARPGGNRLRTNRILLFLVGILVLVITFFAQSVVGAVTIAADILAAALFFPVVGALFWKRATSTGALVSMIVGSVVAVMFMFITGLYSEEPVIYGMLANLITFVVVSLLTQASSEKYLTAWNKRMEKDIINVREETL